MPGRLGLIQEYLGGTGLIFIHVWCNLLAVEGIENSEIAQHKFLFLNIREDVGGLQVTMNNVALVNLIDSTYQLISIELE